MLAILIGVVLSAQAAPAAPDWTAESPMSVDAAGSCVETQLRGKRLGFNILTLRPARYVMGEGQVLEVGPGIRFVVSPAHGGSTIALYSRNWTGRLASFVRPCVAAGAPTAAQPS